MAMDKEALFRYFRENYLPQSDVLARLPVNISFESFWNDLVLRRRAGSVTLPLSNADGEPYWYNITPLMVKVSERISEEMMKRGEPADLYSAGMTTAMTEEMFYTSYVEGAPVQYDEAIDFLSEGREPSDTNELLLWNNRMAWESMIRKLWQPINGERILEYAAVLTKDLENQADDYRRSDDHAIAAMDPREYRIPAAEQLPKRMQELSAYLQDSTVHPLLKAGAAQAYILAIRPFDEGNERLSRLISTAVLLRSGYDFFRDISISMVIAQETYRYYAAMKEIHREDNSGDLTFFMDYYFGLLGRTLDLREELVRIAAQKELEAQRRLAVMPLSTPGEVMQDPEMKTDEPKEVVDGDDDRIQTDDSLPASNDEAVEMIMAGAVSICTEGKTDEEAAPEVDEPPAEAEESASVNDCDPAGATPAFEYESDPKFRAILERCNVLFGNAIRNMPGMTEKHAWKTLQFLSGLYYHGLYNCKSGDSVKYMPVGRFAKINSFRVLRESGAIMFSRDTTREYHYTLYDDAILTLIMAGRDDCGESQSEGAPSCDINGRSTSTEEPEVSVTEPVSEEAQATVEDVAEIYEHALTISNDIIEAVLRTAAAAGPNGFTGKDLAMYGGGTSRLWRKRMEKLTDCGIIRRWYTTGAHCKACYQINPEIEERLRALCSTDSGADDAVTPEDLRIAT